MTTQALQLSLAHGQNGILLYALNCRARKLLLFFTIHGQAANEGVVDRAVASDEGPAGMRAMIWRRTM